MRTVRPPPVTDPQSAPDVMVRTGALAAAWARVPEGIPASIMVAAANTEGVPVLYRSTSVPSPTVKTAEVSPAKASTL